MSLQEGEKAQFQYWMIGEVQIYRFSFQSVSLGRIITQDSSLQGHEFHPWNGDSVKVLFEISLLSVFQAQELTD